MIVTLALTVVAVTAAASALLTRCARRWALRIQLVSRPRADRYGRQVIPLGGGLAITATLLGVFLVGLGVIALLWRPGHWNWPERLWGLRAEDFLRRQSELWATVGCMVALCGLGLWDDRRGLGPGVKLAIQTAVAAAAVAWADVRVELFIPNAWISGLLSVFWIVLMVNTFNFLDNMDGASAGIAVICTAVLVTAAVQSGQVWVTALGLVFIGTLLGFLLFNFPPASIYMGDAGSLVVGFFMAVLSLRTSYYQQAHSGTWYAVFLPAIALSVPLYDFLSVTWLRLRQGKSPFVGDTQHFSHRLRRRGLTDRQTVCTLYLATCCTALGATFLGQVDRLGAVLIFAQTMMILAIVAILEARPSS